MIMRLGVSVLEKIGQTNGERAVFRMIRRTPGISRVELCHMTNLTSAAVTQIVKRYMASGLVRESGLRNSTTGNVGRARIGLSLNTDRYYALGITVRRFDVLFGLVTMDGNVKYSWKDETPNAARLINAMRNAYRITSEEGLSLIGTGLGIPTFSVPWATREDIIETVANEVPTDLYVFHNGSYAAIAEEWTMPAENPQSFFYVFFGSGIGGASVNRRGLEIPVVTPVESGHVGIDPTGELCFCGNRGCVELVASPIALLRRCYPNESDLSILMQLDETTKQEVGESLAYGLVTIANILNTQTVILGGYDEQFLETIYGAVLRNILDNFVTPSGHPLRIITSKLGEFVGVQGAALGAIDEVGRKCTDAHDLRQGPPWDSDH